MLWKFLLYMMFVKVNYVFCSNTQDFHKTEQNALVKRR